MTKRIESETVRADDLIDLGAASLETKGNQHPNLPDEVAGQFIKTGGISQD